MRTKTSRTRQTKRTSAAAQTMGVAKTGGGRVDAADFLGQDPTAADPSAQVPSKWSWHHRVMLALRNRLLGQRGDVLSRVAEPLESHSLDQADGATDEFDRDLELTQLAAAQDELYELEEALKRIRNGTYGVCEESGRPISAARLRAIPWTRFSTEVVERMEKKGSVRRARVAEPNTARQDEPKWLTSEEAAEEAEKLSPPARADVRHRPPQGDGIRRVS